jgi:hypothetical protein
MEFCYPIGLTNYLKTKYSRVILYWSVILTKSRTGKKVIIGMNEARRISLRKAKFNPVIFEEDDYTKKKNAITDYLNRQNLRSIDL